MDLGCAWTALFIHAHPHHGHLLIQRADREIQLRLEQVLACRLGRSVEVPRTHRRSDLQSQDRHSCHGHRDSSRNALGHGHGEVQVPSQRCHWRDSHSSAHDARSCARFFTSHIVRGRQLVTWFRHHHHRPGHVLGQLRGHHRAGSHPWFRLAPRRSRRRSRRRLRPRR